MKSFAAVLSVFVMFGVLTAAPASACHWKKHHCGYHHHHHKHCR